MSEQRTGNARIEEILQEKGDNLEVPRRVQHWAYFPTSDSRAKFISLLGIRFESINAFENTFESSSSGKYAVTFVHVGLPDADSMTQVTDMLNRSAAECGGAYDGWETEILA